MGKTTLANIIANELGVGIRITSGPTIERPGDLAAILTNLGDRDVLFIDEIHRLNRTVEEILYPAMEDFALDIIIGKGPSARSIDIDEDGANEIAKRSRGTPRIANRLLKRVRDYAQIKADGIITLEVACEALDLFEVDSIGLDEVDRKILSTMIEKFNGGPVGIDTLAASTGEEVVTIEDVYEPYLLQIGFIARTPRGRIVTPLGYKHMGKPVRQTPLLAILWLR